MVTVPKGYQALVPQLVTDFETDLLAALTDEGYLLVFPLEELPQLARGKGVKLINIPKKKKGSANQESMLGAVALPEGKTLRIHVGKRYLNLKGKDLDPFLGNRANRGARLPGGFKSVTGLEVVE